MKDETVAVKSVSVVVGSVTEDVGPKHSDIEWRDLVFCIRRLSWQRRDVSCDISQETEVCCWLKYICA